MTVYESMMMAFTSNLVLIGIFTIIVMIVVQRKK